MPGTNAQAYEALSSVTEKKVLYCGLENVIASIRLKSTSKNTKKRNTRS